ncbi:MAG: transporter substrate-binding domain-containing protein [Fibrobacterales bacterium]
MQYYRQLPALLLLLLFTGSLSFAQSDSTIVLSDDEIKWLSNNSITLSVDDRYEPMNYRNEKGEMDGLSIDYIRLIENKVGVSIRFDARPWPEALGNAMHHKTDGIINANPTPDRRKTLVFTRPYIEIPMALFTRNEVAALTSLKEFKGKRLLVKKKTVEATVIPMNYPSIEVIEVETYKEALSQLSTGEADGIFGHLVVIEFQIQKHLFSNIKVNYVSFNGIISKQRIGVGIDKPILMSILDKAIQAITLKEHHLIRKKWVNTAFFKKQIITNPIEKKYLSKKKSISMCIDPDWMPYEKIVDGKHIGMSADYIKLFSEMLHTPITLVETISWAESIKFIKARKCDIVSLAMSTPAREKYMNFTVPYLVIPLVIATKKNKPFVLSFTDVLDKKMGIVKGYAQIELLRNKYPTINLVEVNSQIDGLNQVSNGKLFGFIGTLPSTAYALQNSRFFNVLKINGKFDEKWMLSIGTRNDEPLLNDIFNHAIKALDAKQNREIMNSWIHISYDQGLDYMLMIELFGAVSLVFLFFAYRQYQLKKFNTLLQVLSITDKLTSLYNRVKTDQVLIEQLHLFERYNQVFSIILLDIDHFKEVNDTCGHLSGDKVLVHIATTLKAKCRQVDIIGRWGGEEFLIICPSTTTGGAAKLSEKLRLQLELNPVQNVGIVTISFGVAEIAPKETINSLVKRADCALYKAKQQGRNQVSVADENTE